MVTGKLYLFISIYNFISLNLKIRTEYFKNRKFLILIKIIESSERRILFLVNLFSIIDVLTVNLIIMKKTV